MVCFLLNHFSDTATTVLLPPDLWFFCGDFLRRGKLRSPYKSCSCSSRLRKAYVAANPAPGRTKA